MSYYYGLFPSEKWEERKKNDSIRTGMTIGLSTGATLCFFIGIEAMAVGAFLGMLLGAFLASGIINRKERKKEA